MKIIKYKKYIQLLLYISRTNDYRSVLNYVQVVLVNISLFG